MSGKTRIRKRRKHKYDSEIHKTYKRYKRIKWIADKIAAIYNN